MEGSMRLRSALRNMSVQLRYIGKSDTLPTQYPLDNVRRFSIKCRLLAVSFQHTQIVVGFPSVTMDMDQPNFPRPQTS